MAIGDIKKEPPGGALGPFTSAAALTKGNVVYIDSSGTVDVAVATTQNPKYAVSESYDSGATNVYIWGPGTIIDLKASGTIATGTFLLPAAAGAVQVYANITISSTVTQAQAENIEKNTKYRVGRNLETSSTSTGNALTVLLE